MSRAPNSVHGIRGIVGVYEIENTICWKPTKRRRRTPLAQHVTCAICGVMIAAAIVKAFRRLGEP